MAKMDRVKVLRRGIRLAKSIERQAQNASLKKRLQLVAYGFLVRNRRSASAIEQLGARCAYEARMILRSMLEIMINYAWIRLRNKHSSSTRFLSYQPLELLKVHRSMQSAMSPAEYKAAHRNLVNQRRQVRHLFRFRDKNGKLRWARSWAQVSSIAARLDEVQASENPAGPDPFLYAMYAWFSSTVHGGPNAMKEIFTLRNGKLVPRKQPENVPGGHYVGAAAALAFTLEAAAEDLQLSRNFRGEAERYTQLVKSLRKPKKSASEIAA